MRKKVYKGNLTALILLMLSSLLHGQTIEKRYFKYFSNDSVVWVGVTAAADKMNADVFLHLKGDAEVCAYYAFTGEKAVRDQFRLQAAISDQVQFTGNISDGFLVGELKLENGKVMVFKAEKIDSNGDLKVREMYRNASQKLVPKDVASPEAIIEVRLLVPDDSLDTAFFQRLSTFYELVDEENQHLKVEEQLSQAISGFLSQYAQAASFEGEKGPSFQWFKTVDVSVPWSNDFFTAFAKLTYVFTGGAHGMQHVSYLTINNTDKSAFSGVEVFEPGSQNELSELLTSELKRMIDCPVTDSLGSRGYFVEKVPFTSNFYLHPAGICFYYNSYELAPYAFGHTALHLTYNQLSPYLKEELKAQLKKIGYFD